MWTIWLMMFLLLLGILVMVALIPTKTEKRLRSILLYRELRNEYKRKNEAYGEVIPGP